MQACTIHVPDSVLTTDMILDVWIHLSMIKGQKSFTPRFHHTVILRLLFGSDAYAPLNLPGNLRIVSDLPSDAHSSNILSVEEYCVALDPSDSQHARTRQHSVKEQYVRIDVNTIITPKADLLALIWDTVWWRRVVYFATLCSSLALFVFPFLPALDNAIKVLAVPVIGVLTPIVWFVPEVLAPINLGHILYSLILIIKQPAEAILPSITRPWLDALALYPFSFLYLGALIAALLYFGSLLDRRIQDRALAAWNLRWRIVRRAWFLKSDNARIVAIFLLIGVIAFFVILFFLQVRHCHTVSSSAENPSFTECTVREFYGFFRYEDSTGGQGYKGEERIVRQAAILFLFISVAGTLLWIIYRIHLGKRLRQTETELPGFSLWISRRLRTCRTCIAAHSWILKEVVPFTFAVATLIVIFWVFIRSSFLLTDSAGQFCEPTWAAWSDLPSNGRSAQPSRLPVTPPITSKTVEYRLDKICGSTHILLFAGIKYEIVLDYFDDTTDGAFEQDGELVYAKQYVPVSLRKASKNMSPIWAPFRRVMSAPWFAMIARISNSSVVNLRLYPTMQLELPDQIPLTSKATTFVPTNHGFLYLFVNDAIAVPYAFDFFYQQNKGMGMANLTISSK